MKDKQKEGNLIMGTLIRVFLTTFMILFIFIGCSNKANVKNNSFVSELALHDAIRTKNKKLVDQLISKNVNINIQDKYGSTPLHLAVRLNQFDIVKELIEKGAKVNSVDSFHDTPLLDSTRNGTNKISKLLICKGAKKNVIDRYDMTPLDNALKNKDSFIVMMLQGKNIDTMCQKLVIKLGSYDKSKNKICGKISSGMATKIQLILTKNDEESPNPIGPFDAKIFSQTYCVEFDKTIDEKTNYLVTAIGTNTIDTAIDTVEINEIKIRKAVQ